MRLIYPAHLLQFVEQSFRDHEQYHGVHIVAFANCYAAQHTNLIRFANSHAHAAHRHTYCENLDLPERNENFV